jgi:hypothetical protein
MSKSKRTSKAKRATKPVYQLALFGRKRLVGHAPVETPAERARREREARRQLAYFASDEYRQRQAREATRAEEHRRRIARRPESMRSRQYRLPDDVAAFLGRLFRSPLTYRDQRESITVAEAGEMIDAAYAEGCRQGFIEGRVLDLEPKRQRSAKANAAKRKKPREHNGMRFTLDQRDAAIVAEYAALRPMVGATEAQYRLAQKYDLTDKMIRIIVSKAKRAAT